MAKQKKFKKGFVISLFVLLFFVTYIFVYTLLSKDKPQEETVSPNSDVTENTNEQLIHQISEKDTVYISDDNLQDVRVEEEYWKEIKFFSTSFKEVRKPSDYQGLYEAYTDNGIRFSTDLEIFRIYTVNKEEYYKIPVDEKKQFEELLKESIYTSIDSVKKYKTWNSVEVVYGDKVKKIKKWKYDDLAYKISVKRIVGKIQPEKSKERSEYNFTINIGGEGYNVAIETMGQEYVKVVSDQATAYYEVHSGLFEYIRDSILKIESTKE